MWFALALCCLVLLPGQVSAHDRSATLKATLRGSEEVPPINTNATGRFRAVIHGNGVIEFTLTFANLSSNAIFSHIHFAPRKVGGGIMIFLCGGGGQPACPAATSGTVVGMIAPENVTGPTAQGITAGDLASALRAIARGQGYVNVHSEMFPSGEIRGQVEVN
jgi:hypothetical protein